MINEDNIVLGDTIIGNRLCTNTKNQYKSKLTHFMHLIEYYDTNKLYIGTEC
jgi:hypothetical protein